MRILIVEDHCDSAELLIRLLKTRGFEAKWVATGADALHLCGKEMFDLLIADIGLPDCSGWDLMLKLRGRCAVKSIALSGYGLAADVEKSRAAGFDAHLTKPVDVNLLTQTVGELLGGDN